MIRSQRRRHFWLWLILGPLVLIGLAIGVSVRRSAPVQDAVMNGVESEVSP